MENTGVYSFELNFFLHEKGIWQSMENALQIKRSMGVVRGKTDKADSKIIAMYAYRFIDKLKPYVLPTSTLLRLRALFAQRERLVGMHSQLLVASQSIKGYPKELVKDIQDQNEMLLKNLTVQIKGIDKSIKECLQEDKDLQRKSKLIQSVPGIGQQTAAYLLIVSQGMKGFTSARQFACYSGCAPFAHQSGASIRGKTKVSQFADKSMKTLLDLSAKSAIQYDKELREYYLRRTANGKSKMSTINIVRNKILYRMFAVVKRQTPFVENYHQAA